MIRITELTAARRVVRSFVFYRVRVAAALVPELFSRHGPITCTGGLPHGCELVDCFPVRDDSGHKLVVFMFARPCMPDESCEGVGSCYTDPIDIEPRYEAGPAVTRE